VYTAIDCVLGATHHNAAVQVFADASGGSRLVWLIDFLPDDIAPMLDLAMSRGIDAIPRPSSGGEQTLYGMSSPLSSQRTRPDKNPGGS
jgi:hypothetical protein